MRCGRRYGDAMAPWFTMPRDAAWRRAAHRRELEAALAAIRCAIELLSDDPVRVSDRQLLAVIRDQLHVARETVRTL